VVDAVAERAGFYAGEHLHIAKEFVTSAGVCAQLVATGKGDVCSLSIEPILFGYDKGLRLQLFLGRAARYNFVMGVLADSPIHTLADFKGAVIGETNTGSVAEVTAESMLAGAGLRTADYTFFPIGVGAQALDAFSKGRVAGASYPYAEFIPFEVVAHAKFRYFRHPILKDVANVGYAAAPATIETKADQLRRFSRAIVEAAVFTRYNPRAAARYFLEEIGAKFTPVDVQNRTRELVLMRGDLDAGNPASERIGALDPRGIAFYSRFLTDSGMTKQVVPVDAVMTDRFIGYANAFDRKTVKALAMATR
jgi:ABC-type nitrate/sulfonate/bicarbonate transport system substrate-binding protein